MAPTEPSILEQYLLTPSQLPAIITFQDFAALFPRAHQSSPRIRTLYRDLQSQRNEVVDTVAENIDREVRRRRYFRQAAVTARRDAERLDSDRELERERMLFGAASGIPAPKHSLHSILPELEMTLQQLEAEVKDLEEEEAQLKRSISQTVGDMSDLRYGRLANSELPTQVLEGHADLQETCKRRS